MPVDSLRGIYTCYDCLHFNESFEGVHIVRALKVILKFALCVVVLAGLVLAGYVIYLESTYYRIDDNQVLEVSNNASDLVKTGKTYTAVTYNIGFGAYTADYDFFMDEGEMNDGTKTVGTHAKAVSQESAQNATNGSIALVQGLEADFVLMQEVDTDSDRSWHVNQKQQIIDALQGKGSTYAVNLHSANLFYPLNDPIGVMNSGILTLSDCQISSSTRRSYPIATAFPTKLFDLDRCFDVARLPVEGSDKELVLINSHMSAYDEGGYYRTQQLQLIFSVMKEEADKGNWVIAGGDWNHALCDSSDMYASQQKEPSWLMKLDDSELPEGFSVVRAGNIEEVATCRGADMPYEEGVTYRATIDGFFVSSNVAATAENIDAGFAYSDHNPVKLTFSLN